MNEKNLKKKSEKKKMIPMIIYEYFKMLSSIYPIVKKLQKLLVNTYDNHLGKIMKKQTATFGTLSLLVKQLPTWISWPKIQFEFKGFYTRSYMYIPIRSYWSEV